MSLPAGPANRRFHQPGQRRQGLIQGCDPLDLQVAGDVERLRQLVPGNQEDVHSGPAGRYHLLADAADRAYLSLEVDRARTRHLQAAGQLPRR